MIAAKKKGLRAEAGRPFQGGVVISGQKLIRPVTPQ